MITRVAVPVPLKPTICGLPLALSVSVRLPERVPLAVGENVTLITQLPLAATGALVLQVVPLAVIAKSPVATMLVKVKDAVPVLVTVTGMAALVVPTGWLLKLTLEVPRLTIGARVVSTTCVTSFDVLPARLMVPGWYVALIVYEPTASEETASEPTPALSWAFPNRNSIDPLELPSGAIEGAGRVNRTVPVGVPEPEVTVAVKVTFRPRAEGLDGDTRVVEVSAGLIPAAVEKTPPEVPANKFEPLESIPSA